MLLKDIVPFPAAFDNPFFNNRQHNLPQCLIGKWLDLTLKHGYKNCNCWKALTFVNNPRLLSAIDRALQAAIALLFVAKLICRQLLKSKGFEETYFTAKSWKFVYFMVKTATAK